MVNSNAYITDIERGLDQSSSNLKRDRVDLTLWQSVFYCCYMFWFTGPFFDPEEELTDKINSAGKIIARQNDSNPGLKLLLRPEDREKVIRRWMKEPDNFVKLQRGLRP